MASADVRVARLAVHSVNSASANAATVAPTRRPRQDIISAILSDYSDLRDTSDADADEYDGDLDPYYTQAEAQAAPPAVDKPLPPLMGFQLRVADAPKNMQEPPLILSPSLASRGRRPKPPDLELARSNGSTALTTPTAATPAKPDASSLLPSLTTSAPDFQHHHHTPRQLDHRPLPPTPPPLPAKNDIPSPPSSSAGATIMGNKASKAAADAPSQGHRKPFSLRRKPVRKDTAPAQSNVASAPPPPGQPPAPARPLHKATSDTSLQHSVTARNLQPPVPQSDVNTLIEPNGSSQSHSATPSEATVVRDRSDSPPTEPEEEEPITPTLKPAPVNLLPSPSPVLEDSPSKYGVVRQPSVATMKDKDQKVAMHYRGKSSTGFDIFKSSTNQLQNTRPLRNTLSPPISPNPADNSNFTSPTATSIPNTVSPTSSTFELFNTQVRPEKTVTPRLNCVHMGCFHNHRRFHRSNNRVLPLGCMLCFSSSSDFQWTCTWCALRICQGCRVKLESVPSKSLDIFITEKMGEQTSVDVGPARPEKNKENLTVKRKRRSMHDPNMMAVWEA